MQDQYRPPDGYSTHFKFYDYYEASGELHTQTKLLQLC